MPDRDKRQQRELKRVIKRAGNKHRRRELKRALEQDPEGAADHEEDLGRYRSRELNGLDTKKPQD